MLPLHFFDDDPAQRLLEENMLRKTTKEKLWGIVLAGGEGTRVREFLSQLCGGRGLKQFCAVVGRRSMLEHTLARVERLIPRERMLVVVCQDHRPEASQQLAHWPQENVVWQPANRDTAPGILLPLAHISHRDPLATVAVFPSDHFHITLLVDYDHLLLQLLFLLLPYFKPF